jgi:hypothetical protein
MVVILSECHSGSKFHLFPYGIFYYRYLAKLLKPKASDFTIRFNTGRVSNSPDTPFIVGLISLRPISAQRFALYQELFNLCPYRCISEEC